MIPQKFEELYKLYVENKSVTPPQLQEFLHLWNTHPSVELATVLGNIYGNQYHDDDAALSWYSTAVEDTTPCYCSPEDRPKVLTTAYNNLGVTWYTFNDDVKSIECFQKGVELDPNYGECYWNSSFTFMRQYSSKKLENEALALDLYNFRLRTYWHYRIIENTVPLWQDLTHEENLVVLDEQGFGDSLQCARYFNHLLPYCDNLTIQLTAGHSLQPLFEEMGWKCTRSAAKSGGTATIPLMTLIGMFGDVDHHWIKGIEPTALGGDKISIIVEWKGNSDHKNSHNRDTDVNWFKPLTKWANLYNINPAHKDDCPGWITWIKSDDWLTSAKLVAGCDLVISVDTSLVHLAGSMDKPVWMVQPAKFTDWRWGDISCGSWNRWYPKTMVFRNLDGWEHSFKEIEKKLEEVLNC